MFLIGFKTQHSLVAAVDMLRACTLVAFFKNCAVIASIDLASGALLAKPSILLQYVFIEPIADDVKRVARGETKEIRKNNSYFQYMSKFQLVPRSPYSASINPNLFIWCQFIGVLAGIKRSMYAHMIKCSSPAMILIQAAYVMYYSFSSPAEVLEKMKENNCTITPKMSDGLRCVINVIDGNRRNNVGEFVKKYFTRIFRRKNPKSL